jgi:hypothetical protein
MDDCQACQIFKLKITKIAYNMKEFLRFATIKFLISLNLAKYTYGWLPSMSNFEIKNHQNYLQHERVLKICHYQIF